jgi:hypothetical protein
MTGYSWLPEPLRFRDYGQDQEKLIDVAYAIFQHDFIESQPECFGRYVRPVREPMADGKEYSFKHITTEKISGTRIFRADRCERVGWIRPIIEALSDGKVICWKKFHYEKGKKEWRLLIALDDFSYIVVLAERKGYYLVRTAYPVSRRHTLVALFEEQRNADRCP